MPPSLAATTDDAHRGSGSPMRWGTRLTRGSRVRRALGVGLVVGVLATGCANSTPSAEPVPEPGEGQASAPSPGADDVATTTCEYRPSGDAAVPVEPPSPVAPTEGSAQVTFGFDAGEVTVALDRGAAPCASHSIASLADQGFYTETSCHRLADQGLFMLQCGDPTGTGMGGPGYAFDDEVGPDTSYEAGTVAMANAGPGTNGSQFFLVYQDSPLPPDYTVLGTLDESSLEVVRSIASEGHDASSADGTGRPHNPATINEVTVTSE